MDIQALNARREERRRAIRRRRQIVLGALCAIALGLAGVVIAVRSSGGGHSIALPARPARTAVGKKVAARTQPARTQPTRTQPTRTQPARRRPIPATGRPGTDPVPILMYHVIAAPPAGARFPGLYVTPSEFAGQMHALARAGWRAVTLDQVAAYWRNGTPLPAGKPIVLSFDNGYQSQYSEALPTLRRLGWVGVENMQLTGLPPSQGGLSRTQIRGLLAAGWELDTQGLSHADLITLSASELHDQVAVARRTVQRLYHVPVNWFCYPSGHYDAAVIAAVRDAGYEGSTTVVPGWAHRSEDPYRLHRLRVLGGTTPSALLALIASIRADPPAPPSYGEA
jgi:peptidoglycan/xylan/chitin deacetylase (PgdA/CDA1 family)